MGEFPYAFHVGVLGSKRPYHGLTGGDELAGGSARD